MAININPAHKGELHSELHVAQNQKIPEKKLAKALNSKNPAERKRAQFAENAKHFDHSSSGKRSVPFTRKSAK